LNLFATKLDDMKIKVSGTRH